MSIENAGLLALRTFASHQPQLLQKMDAYHEQKKQNVLDSQKEIG